MPNGKKRKIHKTLQSAVGHTLLFDGQRAVECEALEFSQPSARLPCSCDMWLLRETQIGSQRQPRCVFTLITVTFARWCHPENLI